MRSSKLKPTDWWQVVRCTGDSDSPSRLIKEAALRLLSIPSSSASCERVWSAYAFVHNTRSVKMSNSTAYKRVFVYLSIRQLDGKGGMLRREYESSDDELDDDDNDSTDIEHKWHSSSLHTNRVHC